MTVRLGRAAAIRGLLALGLTTFVQILPTAAHAAELVMLDAKWCVQCRRFLAEVAPIYHTTAAGRVYPLRVVDYQNAASIISLRAPIEGTPTFILVDRGREVTRITGYTSRETFLQQSTALLALQRPSKPRAPKVKQIHASTAPAAVAR